MSLYTQIVKTGRHLVSKKELSETEDDLLVQKQLQKKIKKVFAGSLAIREVAAGSSNAEEHELTALSGPYYDLERFGIHFVASPRHADMLMVSGPVSRNMAIAVKKTYDAMPTPKIVVAVGDGAIDGGIFKGSYGIAGGVGDVIPVDYAIAGNPPSPKAILAALLRILGSIEERKQK